MTAKPLPDRGQELPAPKGRVIGFVDSKPAFDVVAKMLQGEGYSDSKVIALHGDDGISLLERLQDGTFFFADAETKVINFGIDELRAGHYAIAVEVDDRDEALRVAQLATNQGAHSFGYFGTWVNERFS
ncbi:MAG: hypothetical protein WD872_04220 [Pirellulaceae bacterium]